jgi:hypothetical protein
VTTVILIVRSVRLTQVVGERYGSLPADAGRWRRDGGGGEAGLV